MMMPTRNGLMPNMPARLIGLTGKAGSGKDAVAQRLTAAHLVWFPDAGFGEPGWVDVRAGNAYRGPINGVQIASADPMKVIVRQIYGFTMRQLWGPSEERNKPDHRYPRPDGTCLTPREALQLIGTEFGRRAWEDTWIYKTLQTAERLLDEYERVVISDVRFENEIRRIEGMGGRILNVVRPGLNGAAPGIKGHASEQLDPLDVSTTLVNIYNDGSLEDLRLRTLRALGLPTGQERWAQP